MQKKSILDRMGNISSMMLIVIFIALCVVIMAVIGIYAMNRQGASEDETTGAEDTQISTADMETVSSAGESEQSTEEIYEDTDDTKQTDESEGAQQSTEEQSNAGASYVFTDCGDGKVLVTMIVTGGWGDENDPYVQYDVTIQNISDTNISDWCIRLQISQDAELNNIWNGSCEIEDGIATITPADFNAGIMAGTETSFGLIIEKPGDPEFMDVSYQQEEM